MESRNFLVVAAGLTFLVACGLLARGWSKVADDAQLETLRCEARNRRRVVDIPRVVVSPTGEITYKGELVAVIGMMRDDFHKIDALYELLQRERRPACDASRICLDNLVVLQLHTNASSDVVQKVVNSAWGAGYDIVVAAPRNNTW